MSEVEKDKDDRSKAGVAEASKSLQAWEVHEVECLKRFFKHFAIDAVIDVGANRGQYRNIMRNAVGFKGPIFSYEPVVEAFRRLEFIKSREVDSLWFLHNFALSSKSGVSDFNIMENEKFSSLNLPTTEEYSKLALQNSPKNKRVVKVETLFTELRENLNYKNSQRIFLKMDTQGSDVDVLEGVGSEISRIVGLQSELSFRKLYESSYGYYEALLFYRIKGFELSFIFANTAGHFPDLVEMDCIMYNKKILATPLKSVSDRLPLASFELDDSAQKNTTSVTPDYIRTKKVSAEAGSMNCFDALPEILEFTGEFGAELVLFLPFCAYLKKMGLLSSRKIKSYAGMECFYEMLVPPEDFIAKNERRKYIPPAKRPEWLPVKNEHNFDIKERSFAHFYPDFRNYFLGKSDLVSKVISQRVFLNHKPLLVIHNKFNNEWGGEPVNFISAPELDKIFEFLKKDYTIVYLRHGFRVDAGYSADGVTLKDLDDHTVLSAHPEILLFNELFDENLKTQPFVSINMFKNIIYANCHNFVTVQGGGAHQIAYFSNSKMIILHLKGSEINWAYKNGYYSFLSVPAPRLTVCTTRQRFMQALAELAISP